MDGDPGKRGEREEKRKGKGCSWTLELDLQNRSLSLRPLCPRFLPPPFSCFCLVSASLGELCLFSWVYMTSDDGGTRNLVCCFGGERSLSFVPDGREREERQDASRGSLRSSTFFLPPSTLLHEEEVSGGGRKNFPS